MRVLVVLRIIQIVKFATDSDVRKACGIPHWSFP